MKDLKVWTPIITALIALFSSLIVAKLQTESATTKQLSNVVQQVNDKVVTDLEERIRELNDKNEELEDKLSGLVDNCQDIRRILANKFGNYALTPIQRIKPHSMLEPKERFFKKLLLPEK
jgi:ABC-type transporter MlaC component